MYLYVVLKIVFSIQAQHRCAPLCKIYCQFIQLSRLCLKRLTENYIYSAFKDYWLHKRNLNM